MAIRFWGPNTAYGILSNFAATPLVIDGDVFATAEHYYQSQKVTNSTDWKHIIEAASPALARRIAREARSLRPDWEQVKCAVMLTTLREKARQCSEFREVLIASGDEELIEASPWDYFWGEGHNKSGENKLGELLMDVRQMIKDGVL